MTANHDKAVGRVTYASGEALQFTDPQEYLRTIQEELPTKDVTGFRFETLTDDPRVRKAVDDILTTAATPLWRASTTGCPWCWSGSSWPIGCTAPRPPGSCSARRPRPWPMWRRSRPGSSPCFKRINQNE